jgi:hypothetical protein
VPSGRADGIVPPLGRAALARKHGREPDDDKYHNKHKDDPVYRSRMSQDAKRWRIGIREDVIAAYGGRCACCGEFERDFLTLDHVNNDGAEHRRSNAL